MLVFPPDPVIGESYAAYTWDGVKWVCTGLPFGVDLPDASDDAAAAALGIPVGGFYRDGSIVMVRVT